MKVTCFGQQNWDVCWTAKQQICMRLGARGHEVLYVDPDSDERPEGPGPSLRALTPARSLERVQRPGPGVHVYTHVHSRPLRWRLNEALRTRRLAAVTDRLGMTGSVALAIHPAALPLMSAVRPRARVYYAVDEMAAFFRDPVARRAMQRAESLMIRQSDAVVAVSPRLYERFRDMHPNAHLVQNAADGDHFSPESLAAAPPHPDLPEASAPTVGLVGQVDERVDQALLVHVARARPQWRIVLAGRVKEGVDVSALRAEPNIVLLGYQPYDQLASVLRHVDVCTVPYHLTPLTHGCNPLKAWEYLATGQPVVATSLNALLPMRRLIALADGPEAFLAALDAAIDDPARGRGERLAFARANGWESRVDRLLDILAGAVERADAHRSGHAAVVPGLTVDEEMRAHDALTPRRSLAFRATRTAGVAYHALRRAGRALTGRPARVRRILVARRSRLGDTVVIRPLLRALRDRFPKARIVFGVQSGFTAHAMVEDLVDEIRDIEVLDGPSRPAALLGMAKLFGAGWDLVLTGSSYFMLREAWLAGAPRIVGIDEGRALQQLCDVRVRMLPASHEVDNNLALAEMLGADVRDDERAPTLAPPADARARSARIRNALGIPAAERIVVIHPGAQKPSRRWPADRFSALTARLLEEVAGLHVILTGVRDEAGLVEEVHAAVPRTVRSRAHDAVGRTNLTDLMALLAHADAFVCNDTGTMHVARALGTPLVALLGPENDRRWGPYRDGPAPAIALRHEVPCAPCVRWECGPHYCMRLVDADDAYAAVRTILNGEAQPRALDRRHALHGWDELARAGFGVPDVAIVRAGVAEHPGEVLDETDAPLIAIASLDGPDLGACVAVLMRDDTAIAADAANAYRSVDVGEVLRKGGVVIRRAALRAAAQDRAADHPQKLAPSSTALA